MSTWIFVWFTAETLCCHPWWWGRNDLLKSLVWLNLETARCRVWWLAMSAIQLDSWNHMRKEHTRCEINWTWIGRAIDVCLNEMCGEKNEKHHFDSDRNNQKTIEHGQTVKLHLATRTKILGSDTLFVTWFVRRVKDQQPQEQYWSELDSTCSGFVSLFEVNGNTADCVRAPRSKLSNYKKK